MPIGELAMSFQTSGALSDLQLSTMDGERPGAWVRSVELRAGDQPAVGYTVCK